MKTVFITGGAGFIGSHVVRLFVKNYPNDRIVNVDSLSYAGNLENIQDVQNSSNYFLEKVDIRKSELVNRVFEKYNPDSIIHLAAESHVDRSRKPIRVC